MINASEPAIATFLEAATNRWAALLGSEPVGVELSAIGPAGREQRTFVMESGWHLAAAKWAAEQNEQGSNVYWVPPAEDPARQE